MFSRKPRPAAEPLNAGVLESPIHSFLGAGSTLEGRMVFKEKMRIDGIFRGEIVSSQILVVGQAAHLRAEISVGELIVSGRVEGDIKASNRVELRAPARVEGDIIAPSVSIEDGVVFNGTVRMNAGDKRQQIEEKLVELALAS